MPKSKIPSSEVVVVKFAYQQAKSHETYSGEFELEVPPDMTAQEIRQEGLMHIVELFKARRKDKIKMLFRYENS